MTTTTQPWLRAELIAAPETTPGAQLMIPADGVEFHDDQLVFHHQGEVVYVADQGQLRSITWFAKQPNPELARRKALWPNHGTRWTDAQRTDLLHRLRQGQGWPAISTAAGRSRTGCQQEAVKQGWLDPDTLKPLPALFGEHSTPAAPEPTAQPPAAADPGAATTTPIATTPIATAAPADGAAKPTAMPIATAASTDRAAKPTVTARPTATSAPAPADSPARPTLIAMPIATAAPADGAAQPTAIAMPIATAASTDGAVKPTATARPSATSAPAPADGAAESTAIAEPAATQSQSDRPPIESIPPVAAAASTDSSPPPHPDESPSPTPADPSIPPSIPPRVPRQRTESSTGTGTQSDPDTGFLSRAQSSLARATLGAYMKPSAAT